MKICVFGLHHLGCVTAACVAEHFQTIAVDSDQRVVADIQAGKLPIFEPGLQEMIATGVASGRLEFTHDLAAAVTEADIVWVAFDTPVDEQDRADLAFVENQITSLFPYLRKDAVVLISSQMPVGSTRQIELRYHDQHPDGRIHIAYSPENLQLGKAIDVFRKPARIVVGTRGPEKREVLETLLKPFCDNLIWVSVESAEMTKHALNAFLANSIVFINEIAALCEEVGADAKQVERGLKSEERIGPRAYLGAGGPFGGGTLARDVTFLANRAEQLQITTPVLKSILCSNNLHKEWHQRKLEAVCGPLGGKTVAVLGLTYKPGTDTLRRSVAVELCKWLFNQGANVRTFDPVVRQLPEPLNQHLVLCDSAVEALKGSDAVVITTEWPQFKNLTSRDLIENMKTPVVLDANRFLENSLPVGPGLTYAAVGMPRMSA